MTALKEILDACADECMEMDTPLSERLKVIADEVRARAPGFTVIVDRMVNRLLQAEAGVNAPKVGEPMPPFVLPDQDGHLVSLAALLEKGKVVVSFNRGHWCPYCRINVATMAEIADKVAALGGSLVVITPELRKFNQKLKADSGAGFPILTDLDNGYALDLQMAVKIPLEKSEAMNQAGWNISPYQGNDNWILPIPATFIIGRDGVVKARYVDPDYRKRMEIDELLAGLKD